MSKPTSTLDSASTSSSVSATPSTSAREVVKKLSSTSEAWVPSKSQGLTETVKTHLRSFAEYAEENFDMSSARLQQDIEQTYLFSSRFMKEGAKAEGLNRILVEEWGKKNRSPEDIIALINAEESQALQGVILGKFSPLMETSPEDINATKNTLAERADAAVKGPGYPLICIAVLGKLGTNIASEGSAPVNNKMSIDGILSGDDGPLAAANIEMAHKAAQSNPVQLEHAQTLASSLLNMLAIGNDKGFREKANSSQVEALLDEVKERGRIDSTEYTINPIHQRLNRNEPNSPSGDSQEIIMNPLHQRQQAAADALKKEPDPDVPEFPVNPPAINEADYDKIKKHIKENNGVITRPPDDVDPLVWWIEAHKALSEITKEAGNVAAEAFSDIPFIASGIGLAVEYFNLLIQTQLAIGVLANNAVEYAFKPNIAKELTNASDAFDREVAVKSANKKREADRNYVIDAISYIGNNKVKGSAGGKSAELTEDVRRGYGPAK